MLLLICIRIYIKKKVDARKYIQFLEKEEKNETNGNEICFLKYHCSVRIERRCSKTLRAVARGKNCVCKID